jgi:hypothetical protein
MEANNVADFDVVVVLEEDIHTITSMLILLDLLYGVFISVRSEK